MNVKKTILMVVIVIALAAAMIGGATMAWFTDSASSETVEFTAGTLLVDANTVSFYGVETLGSGIQGYQGQGRLFEIFVKNDEVIFNEIYKSQHKDLNGAAFDRKNQRLYYANEASSRSTLYFYDLKEGTGDKEGNVAGSLKYGTENHRAWGAAFGMGHYWYINTNTDDLYRVSFKDDGKIDTIELYHKNFAGGKVFQFGDLAMEIREGIIYASTYNNPREYFTYNIYTKEYTQVNGADAFNLQLAFGADGVLYGHETRVGTWYKIDEVSGKKNSTTPFYSNNEVLLSDLASNYQNNWNPGDCDLVNYVFKNIGTKNMVFKFTPELKWAGYEPNEYWDGEDLGLSNIDVDLCDNSTDWEKVGDTYYYVGTPLVPGGEVTLCLKICLDGPETGNAYQGATLTLEGIVEAVQSSNNAPYHQWNLEGTAIEGLYDYLLLTDN